MSETFSAAVFEISDQDISWASRLLALPDEAFFGSDGGDPRCEVIKSLQSLDVAACPGSGKTTLLVAKLAMLAEKWHHKTTGICVLSHTNVARGEIENRLGNTTTGRRLLSYPHYIGTIHGFVNEFLALPILRSHGLVNTQFNTDVCSAKIWKLSNYGKEFPSYLFTKIKDPEERKSAVCKAHYIGEDLNLKLGRYSLLRKNSTDAFQKIHRWKRIVLREGYAAFEDTFAYGQWALREHPQLINTLRDRFPLLFVDEAQDNSDEQSVILNRIFIQGGTNVTRQRFGDPNQAIFDFIDAKEATKDKFPGGTIRDLPNSHRFGQEIANLANPLGIMPIPGGLKGQGPKKPLVSLSPAQHTIFLFDADNGDEVIPAYCDLLLRTFPKQELQTGTFAAVGQIHRPAAKDEIHKYPHHVGHYWPEYDAELTKRHPKPATFVQYVFLGIAKAEATGESYLCVEKIAEAILHLARTSERMKMVSSRRKSHRHVLELLQDSEVSRERYQEFAAAFAGTREVLTEESWETKWRSIVREVAETLVGTQLTNSEADEFLKWNDVTEGSTSTTSTLKKSRDNVYRHPPDNPQVEVRVGSIHSVKGQTHTATLVLETFWHKHNLDKLKPWLLGLRTGWKKADRIEQNKRLKLHYVAMTRPTHLLCLAMKRISFINSVGQLDAKELDQLKVRGWQVKIL